MEKRVIEKKLDNLGNCLKRIQDKIPGSAQALKSDYDLQDIISLNLERAIQTCIDVASHLVADYDDVTSSSAASLFLDLVTRKIITEELGERLAKAAGFRNLLVNRYTDIDWLRVHNNLKTELHVFRAIRKRNVRNSVTDITFGDRSRDFAAQVEKFCE